MRSDTSKVTAVSIVGKKLEKFSAKEVMHKLQTSPCIHHFQLRSPDIRLAFSIRRLIGAEKPQLLGIAEGGGTSMISVTCNARMSKIWSLYVSNHRNTGLAGSTSRGAPQPSAAHLERPIKWLRALPGEEHALPRDH